MNVTLVSFGDKIWEKALSRLKSQSKQVPFITNTFMLNPEELDRETNFYKDNQEFINSHPQGHGAWVWKPYIIEKAFEKFPESDFFMYLDSGSEFNINDISMKRLIDYFIIADKEDVLAMINRDYEVNLTHCSVINDIYPLAKETKQFEANTLIFKNNKKALDIVKSWKYECIKDEYSGVRPVHRYKCCDSWWGIHLHDQSVLSCVLKKNGVKGILDEASWYLSTEVVGSSIKFNRDRYPIFTARNKNWYPIAKRDCLQYLHFKICIHDGECPDLIVVR